MITILQIEQFLQILGLIIIILNIWLSSYFLIWIRLRRCIKRVGCGACSDYVLYYILFYVLIQTLFLVFKTNIPASRWLSGCNPLLLLVFLFWITATFNALNIILISLIRLARMMLNRFNELLRQIDALCF